MQTVAFRPPPPLSLSLSLSPSALHFALFLLALNRFKRPKFRAFPANHVRFARRNRLFKPLISVFLFFGQSSRKTSAQRHAPLSAAAAPATSAAAAIKKRIFLGKGTFDL